VNTAQQIISDLTRGTYILILYLPDTIPIKIGKLGDVLFHSGFYGYVGSALGAGGLRARLKHHLFSEATPRWHIDYLRRKATITQIWYAEQDKRREHDWANALYEWRDTSAPISGFGSSDCNCPTHLFYFSEQPVFSEFQKIVQHRFPDDLPLKSVDILLK
jgi:Uri superfamily endonuclease